MTYFLRELHEVVGFRLTNTDSYDYSVNQLFNDKLKKYHRGLSKPSF